MSKEISPGGYHWISDTINSLDPETDYELMWRLMSCYRSNDFMNNMTHELKTPLATISLAIDALTNEKVIHDTEKIRYYSGMIKDENKRMNKQVEKILQSASKY